MHVKVCQNAFLCNYVVFYSNGSKDAVFNNVKAIRGGIPVVFRELLPYYNNLLNDIHSCTPFLHSSVLRSMGRGSTAWVCKDIQMDMLEASIYGWCNHS